MTRTTMVRRAAAVLVGLCLALSSAVVTAAADTLDDRNAAADSSVAQSQALVSASADELNAASARVEAARVSLSQAQSALGTAEAVALQAAQDLADAQAVDAQKALELQEANEALAQAQADETAAQQAVDAQQDAIGAYARAIYQDSLPLVAIASLFDADSVTSLGNRIQWTTTILDTNNRIREELEVSHAALVRGRLAREDAQAKADEAKAAAQAQVEATQDAKDAADAAEAQAQAARDAVQNALNEQVAAQEAARQTLEANKDRLAQAQAEKAAVVAAIEERARQEAAAAAAAAAAQGGSGSGGPVPSGNWLTYPVTPVIISSGFGWRVDPISGASAFHNGVDFAAACGTPVRAAASGTVVTKRWAWDGGNELYVDHGWIGGNHVITSYHHMSGYAVNAGVWVSQGQVIGYVGTTGYSTGCHLHLILWLNGTPVNALGYL